MKNETIKRIISSIVLLPIIFFIIMKGSFYFSLFLFICLILAGYEWNKMTKGKSYSIFGFFFLFFSFYSVYYLRNDSDIIFFLLTVIICISTDIGGYLFGKTFKGPKLTKISPNKTFSGMIGSFILAVIFGIFFINNLANLNFNNSIKISADLIIMILLISLVSQIGDLIISFYKRKSKMKNTGKIIPGHGGLLDRIDGMIFAFPFAFLILKIL